MALGLAVLAFVASNIAWKDELMWYRAPLGEGEDLKAQPALVVQGTLVGDWKEDLVHFVLDDDAEFEEGWPSEPAALLISAGEGGLEVQRRSSKKHSIGFDWRPGVPRAFRDVKSSGLFVGTLLIALGLLLCIYRWRLLLAIAGCPASLLETARLTLLGYFFNLVMPGMTGGDLIKGVVVARNNPKRRTDALVSIVVDRVIGLLALMALTGVTLLVAGEEFSELRLPIWGLVVAVFGGALIYANPRLRALFRVEQILQKLPLGDKLQALDRAAVIYLRHPVKLAIAGLLSLGNHTFIILGVWVFGRSFGVDAESVSLGEFFVVVPVANIVGALPLAPGGWGLGEAVYKGLFERIGASGALGVATSVTFRLTQLGFGLLGGVYLLLPSGRQAVREAESLSAEDRGAA
ncbi:MAG: hypothetical protein ACI8QS_003478 [Planctomycetota bacterium]